MSDSNCDKCGQLVDSKNDAVMLEMAMSSTSGDMTLALIFATPRHLLPTEDCPGSPSRAQYLEGQPRDTRGYSYRPELEAEVREAFKLLQSTEL